MNKALYYLSKFGLYLLGFPLLAVLTLIYSLQWNDYGMYGAGAFAPFILTIVLWVLTFILQVTLDFIKKKKGIPLKKLCFKNAILAIILFFGVFLILEAIMPSVLKDATSNTIFYEDAVEDAMGLHNKLQERAESFMSKNNFEKGTKFQEKAVQDKFHEMFPSMNAAYNSFDKLAIDLAIQNPDIINAVKSGKIPLSVFATLILKTSDEVNGNDRYKGIEEILLMNKANIVQALNILLNNLDKITDPSVLNEALNKVLVTKNFDGIDWNIMQILGYNPLNPSIDPNANIIQTVKVQKLDSEGNPVFDAEGNPVMENKAVELGACLGYQDMAWLDGLDQMFFVPLLAARKIFLAFGLAIGLLSLIFEAFKLYFYKKEKQINRNNI